MIAAEVSQQSLNNDKGPPGIWTGQLIHLLSLTTLLIAVSATWQFLGQPTPIYFWAAVASPIAHQLFVWFAWRLELNGQVTSRLIGFNAYVVIFFILFLGRFVSLAALGIADRGSLALPTSLRWGLTGCVGLPAVYAMFSVVRYFGLVRASGADHFDARYRDMPLVRKGIFRFTNNGMYVYAFLSFWAIAVALDSSSALAVAVFSHAYIWIHYFATEKPDMDFLYAASCCVRVSRPRT